MTLESYFRKETIPRKTGGCGRTGRRRGAAAETHAVLSRQPSCREAKGRPSGVGVTVYWLERLSSGFEDLNTPITKKASEVRHQSLPYSLLRGHLPEARFLADAWLRRMHTAGMCAWTLMNKPGRSSFPPNRGQQINSACSGSSSREPGRRLEWLWESRQESPCPAWEDRGSANQKTTADFGPGRRARGRGTALIAPVQWRFLSSTDIS
ncbi:uncharacterized protein LOC125350860 [Perognathus longimembris pacificus]|uniref:uncharacterized protein LOC125350860 n=1 Tax=Perognathus longimembris pacificus TaxID=214514 RepID=UPI002019E082|nr:uncharacterized protein LOC125350860 [Perognathus longimembris pacificus]